MRRFTHSEKRVRVNNTIRFPEEFFAIRICASHALETKQNVKQLV